MGLGGAFSFVSTEGGILILGTLLTSRYPDFSHWIWPIIGAMLLFVGFFPPGRIVLWFKRKESEVPIEARKFKDLYSHMRHCWLLLEHKHYTRREELEKLIPLLEELSIKTPSRTRATLLMWKDFLEQLLPLAEAEASAGNLEMARKIYKELLK